MAITWRHPLLLVLSAALGVGLTGSARADIVITPTSNNYQVGLVSNFGNLYNPNVGTFGTGFRRVSDGYDPIVGNTVVPDGFAREYWGITAGGFHGYSDPNGTHGGPGETASSLNIAVNTPLTAAPGNHSAALSLFLTNGSGTNVLRIDQTYTFPLQNVLDIHITLTNLTNSMLTNVQYRRGIDWDIAPFVGGTTTNNTIVVPPLTRPVTAITTNDLDNADPFFAYNPQPNPPFQGDRAGGLTLTLPSLFPEGDLQGRDSFSFDIFEGISTPGESPGNLVGDLNAAGANYVILGFGPGGANSAAIGVAVPAVPEPATVTLLGLGLAGLAGWRWRRRSA